MSCSSSVTSAFNPLVTSSQLGTDRDQQRRLKSLLKREVSVGNITKPIFEYLKHLDTYAKITDMKIKGSAAAWVTKKKSKFRDLDFVFEIDPKTNLNNLKKNIDVWATRDHLPIVSLPPVKSPEAEFLLVRIDTHPTPLDIVFSTRSTFESLGSNDAVYYRILNFVRSNLKNKQSITIDVAKGGGFSLFECLKDLEEMRSSYPNAKRIYEGLRAYTLRLTKGIIPRNFQHEKDFCETFFTGGNRSKNFEFNLSRYLFDHFENSIPSRVIFLLNLQEILARSEGPLAAEYRQRIIHIIHKQLGVIHPISSQSLIASADAMVAHLDINFGKDARTYEFGSCTLRKIVLPNGAAFVSHRQRSECLSDCDSLALSRFKNYFSPPQKPVEVLLPPKEECVESRESFPVEVVVEPRESKEEKETISKDLEDIRVKATGSMQEAVNSTLFGPHIPNKLKSALYILNHPTWTVSEKAIRFERYLKNHAVPNILKGQICELIHECAKTDLISVLPLLKSILPHFDYNILTHKKTSEYLQKLLKSGYIREALELYIRLYKAKGVDDSHLNELGSYICSSDGFKGPEGIKLLLDIINEHADLPPKFIVFCSRFLTKRETYSMAMQLLEKESGYLMPFIKFYISSGCGSLIPDPLMKGLLDNTEEIDNEIIEAIKKWPNLYVSFSEIFQSLENKKRFARFFKSYCSQPEVLESELIDGMNYHWGVFKSIKKMKKIIPLKLFETFPKLNESYKLIESRLLLVKELSKIPRDISDAKQIEDYYLTILKKYQTNILECSSEIRNIENQAQQPYKSALIMAHIRFLLELEPPGDMVEVHLALYVEALNILTSNMEHISLIDFAKICLPVYSHPQSQKAAQTMIEAKANAAQKVVSTILKLSCLIIIFTELGQFDPECESLFMQIKQLKLSLFDQDQISVICEAMYLLTSWMISPNFINLFPKVDNPPMDYLTIARFWRETTAKEWKKQTKGEADTDFIAVISAILKHFPPKKVGELKSNAAPSPKSFEALYKQLQVDKEKSPGDFSKKIEELCRGAPEDIDTVYMLAKLSTDLKKMAKERDAQTVLYKAVEIREGILKADLIANNLPK